MKPSVITGRRGGRRTSSDADQGSGTVLAVGLVGVLSVLLVAGLLVAAVAIAGQQARTAADLGALAVAGEALRGGLESDACSTGSQVVGLHAAVMVSCRVTRGETGLARAEVEVTKSVPGTRWSARAEAAAGGVPVEE